MNPALLIMGIIISVVLIAASMTMFISGKNRAYGVCILVVAIAIILAMFVLGIDNPNKKPGTGENPSASPSISPMETSPSYTESTVPTDKATETNSADVTNLPAEGVTSIPTEAVESLPTTGEPTEIPTEAPTKAPENTVPSTATNAPAAPTDSSSQEWNGSTVYLTFDDGPSTEVTPIILDTLKKYNIKATFFVCNFSDAEIPILKRILDEGHTLGLHTYTHDYANIYSSEEAYWEDFNKLSDKLYAATGYRANVMRFPGGSSNNMSKKYCVGIMTKLTNQMLDKGYQYFDWNVDSEDAVGDGKTAEDLVSTVIDALRNTRKQNVVLMHDLETKITTGQAVEGIIEEALKLGYKFDKLTVDTEPIHHKVNN